MSYPFDTLEQSFSEMVLSFEVAVVEQHRLVSTTQQGTSQQRLLSASCMPRVSHTMFSVAMNVRDK